MRLFKFKTLIYLQIKNNQFLFYSKKYNFVNIDRFKALITHTIVCFFHTAKSRLMRNVSPKYITLIYYIRQE